MVLVILSNDESTSTKPPLTDPNAHPNHIQCVESFAETMKQKNCVELYPRKPSDTHADSTLKRCYLFLGLFLLHSTAV